MENAIGAARRAQALARLAEALGSAEQHLQSSAIRIDPLQESALVERIRAARAEVDALQRRAPREITQDIAPKWSLSAAEKPGKTP